MSHYSKCKTKMKLKSRESVVNALRQMQKLNDGLTFEEIKGGYAVNYAPIEAYRKQAMKVLLNENTGEYELHADYYNVNKKMTEMVEQFNVQYVASMAKESAVGVFMGMRTDVEQKAHMCLVGWE